MDRNLSVYAIPAYWILSLLPHNYAVVLVSRATNGAWNNANPRSTNFAEQLPKRMAAADYGRYERAEAAHKNGMENLPLFATAIVLGNMAELHPSTLNTVAATFLALRVLYTVLYITIEKRKYSYSRTLTWILSVVVCLFTIVRAAGVFASVQP